MIFKNFWNKLKLGKLNNKDDVESSKIKSSNNSAKQKIEPKI